MLRIIRRFTPGLLALIFLLALIAAAYLLTTIRRSFPQTHGQVRISGLKGPVDILRDPYGVPHIYAQTAHDLFLAQGYVHAQDRFWQMDFWRHIGSARLSEMFGPAQLETDKFLRTLGWARVAQQELEDLDPESRALLQAYADGVNAYLADHKGSALSMEYVILKLINKDYQVEPWQLLNTLTWAKSMAWDLRGNMGDEIERAILLKTLTSEQVDDLYPPYPSDHPVILPNTRSAHRIQTSALKTQNLEGLAEVLEISSQRFATLDSLLGSEGEGIGSNNWVISGKLTTTGKPFLANDPHLSAQMPSIWYEVGLHCTPKGLQCPYDVTGFSFAGVPAVIIGHNDRIAWGFTNVGPDVMDLYIEKVNPQNPNQYEVNGQWVEMERVRETIQVAGSQPVEITIRYTRHGPIISDSYPPLQGFDQNAGIELPDPYAIALRWTALEPAFLFRAILKFNSAQNWEQFREGARDLSVPAQNLVYADVDGNIGYQMPGRIPLRKAGDGRLPVPGWTDEYEWNGTIPFEELPYAFNPSQGYIATANNPVVSQDYPYLISTDWDYGYRARRIDEMIVNAPGPIDIAYIQKMQGDNKNMNAEILVPILMSVVLDNRELKSRRDLFLDWDGQNDMNSAPAALFSVFWKHLLEDTLYDELPMSTWPSGDSRSMAIFRRLVGQPDSHWWDKKDTAVIETRDDIFRQSFGEAVDELESRLGTDASSWGWGDLHTVTFKNQTLGQSGIKPIEILFNRGPLAVGGGSSIVNATSWDASNSEDTYLVRYVPSMRMIVDLSNLQNSLAIHTTGQSGHAYHPHYIDMAELWADIQYHPMHWDRDQVEASAVDRLQLLPIETQP